MADKIYTGKLPPQDGGGDYSVTLPEGSAAIDVYNAALAQKNSTADLSAPFAGGNMVESVQAEKHNTLGGAAADIATSAGVGGILGASAPELAIGAGRGIAMIPHPYAREAGTALMVGGEAMKAHRLGLAAKGLLEGAVSETAGQIADKAGAPAWGSVTARVAGGLGASGIVSGLEHLISGPAASMWKFATKVMGKDTAKEAVVKTAKESLKQIQKDAPKQEVNEILAKGSQAEVAAASKKAQQLKADTNANAAKLLATNKPAAMKLLEEGDKQAAALLKAAKDRADALTIASNGKTATAARVAALSDKARETIIGPQKELTDIGEELRSGIQETHGAMYAARKEQDAVLRNVRDQVVKQKVAAGDEISNMPDLAAIRNELASDARLTPEGIRASKGRAKVTDPGTVRSYQQLYDSLTPKGGAKLDMQAIDTVRRRLADVGTPGAHGAEGYDALQKHFAANMAKRLGKLQEDYVGEAQKALQATYHEGSEQIRGVSGGLSRKATAVDKINPEEFTMDAKDLPKKYFYSAQKVEDLSNLVGPEKTQQLAEQYLSRTFAGHDSKYVENFIQHKDNTDWMRQVDGLQKKASDYLEGLKRIENATERLNAHAVRLAKGGPVTKAEAQKAATATKQSFAAQAKVIQELQDKRVKNLVGPAAGTAGGPAAAALERFIRQSTSNAGSTIGDDGD